MQQSLIQQGVDMMLFGMGTVFTFLIVLVLAVALMSRAVSQFFPEMPPVDTETPPAGQPVDALTTKVIQAAIDQHRSRH